MIKITYYFPGSFERKIVSAPFFDAVKNLGEIHQQRLAKYDVCWDFYRGRHWTMEAPEGFEQITINFSKKFIKKIREFTFRNDWTVIFPDDEQEEIQKWVDYVWNESNNKHEITTALTEYGGVFGDWFAYVQWIPETEDEKGYVKISPLDPRFVFPEYDVLTSQMLFCVILVPFEEVVFRGGSIQREEFVHREVHTKDTIFTAKLNKKDDILEEDFLENSVGKILVVHGINQSLVCSEYGMADTEDVWDVQKLINSKASDVSEILAYHAAPTTIVTGAKSRDLEKGAKKLWAIPNEKANAKNLELAGDLRASSEFINLLKKWMHELVGVPENALGANRKISNTSAVALAIDYEPLIELAEDKRFLMAQGLKSINNLIIDLGVKMGELPESIYKLENPYKQHIDFGPMLPRDKSHELDMIITERSAGLETRKGALVRLGVRDVETKLQELDEEKNEIDMEEAKRAIKSNSEVHGDEVLDDNIKQKGV